MRQNIGFSYKYCIILKLKISWQKMLYLNRNRRWAAKTSYAYLAPECVQSKTCYVTHSKFSVIHVRGPILHYIFAAQRQKCQLRLYLTSTTNLSRIWMSNNGKVVKNGIHVLLVEEISEGFQSSSRNKYIVEKWILDLHFYNLRHC